MLFSVIIPTYNRADSIQLTLHSVLDQSYRNFELIVVDDGSTDNTEEVIGAIRDARLVYLQQENSERGAARNTGIKAAKGDLLVFLDSDDHWHDTHLQTLYEAACTHSDIDAFATKYVIIRDGISYPSNLNVLQEGEYATSILWKGNPFACHFAIRNRPGLTLFREERGLVMMEDWIFLIENLASGSIYIIDSVTIELMDHPDRSMNRNHDEVIQARLNALKYLNKLEVTTEIKTIAAYSFYFCAVHSYLAFDRRRSLSYIIRAFKQGVLDKAFLLHAFKSMIGKRMVGRIVNVLR